MNVAQSNNLSEYSASYREMANIYEEFSIAEDYLGLIFEYLIPHARKKVVADIGCGNGKYLHALAPHSASMVGLDRSIEQLSLAKKGCLKESNVSLSLADATDIPLSNASVDVVLACWMLGTILEKNRQEKALSEIKRICKPGGKVIFVENLPDSEFEKLRGRSPDPLNRTINYNNFLFENGFKLACELDTYFKFSTAQRARKVFNEIWKDRLVGEINSNLVQHKVGIFCFEK